MEPLSPDAWSLDPDVVFLNHGSFGACPAPVRQAQDRWRARLEAEPVRFFTRELEPALDAARAQVAAFVGAAPEDFAFVRNATAGCNAVLRSLDLAPGDEIVVTQHGYPAVTHAARHVCERAGARLVTAQVPFPLVGPAAVQSAMRDALSTRTQLVLVDWITSPTALVLPVADIVRECAARGIDVLVDAAHAAGMVDVDCGSLGAAYVTGNLHKWVCAPKGAAFLVVRRDRQAGLQPAVLGHGLASRRAAAGLRSAFHDAFDWCGTDDPTPWLAVPQALEFLGTLLPGGWPALRARNRELALAARRLLGTRLGVEEPAPASMVGCMAAVPLPPGGPPAAPSGPLYVAPLQGPLYDVHRIQVPIVPFPAPPARLVRVSAQAYNGFADYARLADALEATLSR